MNNNHEHSAPEDFDHEELRRVLHDLSNTLTGLLMNAGLLGVALRGNERLRRYADEITGSGERGAALVRHARSMLLPPGGEHRPDSASHR